MATARSVGFRKARGLPERSTDPHSSPPQHWEQRASLPSEPFRRRIIPRLHATSSVIRKESPLASTQTRLGRKSGRRGSLFGPCSGWDRDGYWRLACSSLCELRFPTPVAQPVKCGCCRISSSVEKRPREEHRRRSFFPRLGTMLTRGLVLTCVVAALWRASGEPRALPSPATHFNSTPASVLGGADATGDNATDAAAGSRISSIVEHLPALKNIVIFILVLTAALITCLVIKIVRSGRRIQKTRKYDIITTPAERVEMAPLNEENDDDDDSTLFDVKYR